MHAGASLQGNPRHTLHSCPLSMSLSCLKFLCSKSPRVLNCPLSVCTGTRSQRLHSVFLVLQSKISRSSDTALCPGTQISEACGLSHKCIPRTNNLTQEKRKVSETRSFHGTESWMFRNSTSKNKSVIFHCWAWGRYGTRQAAVVVLLNPELGSEINQCTDCLIS